MKEANRKKYGLSQAYINYLKLPAACNVKVYELDKILNAKKKLTTSEKIEHLLHVKEALEKRMKIIENGGKVKEFDFMSPQEFAKKHGLKDGYEGKKLSESDMTEAVPPPLGPDEEAIDESDSEVNEEEP